MSILILCDAGDSTASWLAQGLRRRHLSPMRITGGDLVSAVEFGHTVGADVPRFRMRFRDGRTITHRSVVGVVNRLTYLPEPGDARASESDRRYAHDEFTAITLSWLSALADSVPFLNRPSPAWLGGVWRSPAEWAMLSHAAGLSAAPVVLPSAPGFLPATAQALTFGLVVADLAWVSGASSGLNRPALRDGLVRLARLADSDTLAVGLDRDGHVVHVNQVPDLRPAGEPGISRLTQLVRPEGARE